MEKSLEKTRRKLLKVPVQSHRICFTPPAMNCDYARGMLSARDAHQKLSAQVFHLGLLTKVPSARHVPKFQKATRCAASTTLFIQTVQARCNIVIKEYWECFQNPISQTAVVGQCSKLVFLTIAVSGCCVHFLHSNKTV